MFKKLPPAVVTTLNDCFPNLGNQLNDLQEVATEFQKDSTQGNESKFQCLVSGLVVDLMAKGIGREIANNGLFTSVPCAEAEPSTKSESGEHKRSKEPSNISSSLKKKKKYSNGSSSVPKGLIKDKTSKHANETPVDTALVLLKKLYPSKVPNVVNVAARTFKAAMEKLLASKKDIKKYCVNSDGWDLFCACVDREDPLDVYNKFFLEPKVKMTKESFTTWFHEVKASMSEIKKPAEKYAILTIALEKMKEYFTESEEDEASNESEKDTGEDSSDDNEVCDYNCYFLFFFILTKYSI